MHAIAGPADRAAHPRLSMMPLPAFVRDSAGRLEPFDPDRLYRRLFAATEAAGYADPLAAQELTDALLHFLSRHPRSVIDLADLRQELHAVLRELAHAPVLAGLRSEATGSDRAAPWLMHALPPASEGESQASQRYGRALALAEELGLLELDSLGTADGLAALVTRLPMPGSGALEFIEQMRASVTGRLVIDSPDLDAVLKGWTARELRRFIEELAWAAAVHGLPVELHLNLPDPHWGELAAGPLFRTQVNPADVRQRDEMRRVLADATLSAASRLWSAVSLVWHRQAEEPLTDWGRQLEGAARLGLPIQMVGHSDFGHSLGRRQPVLLQRITLDLATLWYRQAQPLSLPRFAGKVQCLARLATAAGSCKRHHLRSELGPDATYWLEASHVQLLLRGGEDLEPQLGDGRARIERRLRRTLRKEGQQRSLPFAFVFSE